MKRFLIILLILFPCLVSAAFSDGKFPVTYGTEPLRAEPGKKFVQEIIIGVPQDSYIYKDKTDLEFVVLDGVAVLEVQYPKPSSIPDPLDGHRVEVYKSDVMIKVVMEVPADSGDGIYAPSAVLHYQGCADRVCLRPADEYIDWKIYVGNVEESESEEGFSLGKWLNIIKGKTSGTILNVELKWLFLMAFLGGIFSSLTPCILPLIPVTMLIIGVSSRRRIRDNLKLTVSLAIGMALTFALLGMIASVAGLSFGFLFQSKLFILLVVMVLFFMGLSLMGLYTLQLPLSIRNALAKLGGGGVRGAFFSGVSMGLLATPCIGPIVAVLLLYAASSGDPKISFFLLGAYALGLGLVIVVAGSGYGALMGRLKKAKVKWVKKFIGILLIITSLYYFHSLVPFTVIFNPAQSPISWQHDYKVLENENLSEEEPMMVLFTADWCPPCKILKFLTLRDPGVVELSGKFKSIIVDMTAVDRENEAVANKYNVLGWPTIIFLSPKGEIFSDLTIFGGYISPAELMDKMSVALQRSYPGEHGNPFE